MKDLGTFLGITIAPETGCLICNISFNTVQFLKYPIKKSDWELDGNQDEFLDNSLSTSGLLKL